MADGHGDQSGGAATATEPARDLDLSDADAVARLAEDVRARLIACLDRAAEAARGHDLEQSAAVIRRLRNRIERADTTLLTPRGLFDSRGKRLASFREAFLDVVRDLTEGEAELRDRAPAFERRQARLDALHAELKGLIAELDGWITRGFTALTQARAADPQAAEPLAHRLADLGALRQAVVARLPMIRACQNAELNGPPLADRACKALAAWRDAWSQALGVAGRRNRRVRPDPDALEAPRTALLDVMRATETALESAGRRRSETGARIPRL